MKKFIIIVILLLGLIYFIYKYNQCNDVCTNIEIYKYGDDGSPKIAFLGGVHGNEPAGTVGLLSLIASGYFRKMAEEKSIQIVVIPKANPCGLKNNTRYQPDLLHPDINRNFGNENGTGIIAKKIINEFLNAELIVDFHEGWSWHKIDKDSVGSTVMPTTPMAAEISAVIVDNLNKNIPDIQKQFMILHQDACNIKSSLRCHMSKKKRNYILIEISGQNDIQPIELRASQVATAVQSVLNFY